MCVPMSERNLPPSFWGAPQLTSAPRPYPSVPSSGFSAFCDPYSQSFHSLSSRTEPWHPYTFSMHRAYPYGTQRDPYAAAAASSTHTAAFCPPQLPQLPSLFSSSRCHDLVKPPQPEHFSSYRYDTDTLGSAAAAVSFSLSAQNQDPYGFLSSTLAIM